MQGMRVETINRENVMQGYSRRNVLGLMGGVMAGGALCRTGHARSGRAGRAGGAVAAPAGAVAAAPGAEPEKGFSWTPRKLPDLAKVQAVARERFYHQGWG